MSRITLPRQIGLAIREKRERLNMTQQQLADAADVSRGFINRVEKGEAAAVYPAKLFAVLDVLGLVLHVEDSGCEMSLDLQDVALSICRIAEGFSAIERAYVFGSFARGTAAKDSDIDIRVELKSNETFNLRDLDRFARAVEESTGREVDVVSARTIKNSRLAAAIERDKVLVYECQKG